MKSRPITHLILSTTSSDEDYSGDCDYCLVPMTAEYVAYLLEYMDEVARLHRADELVFAVELWDGSAVYLASEEKVQSLPDIAGRLVEDVPQGEPALMTGDLPFGEDGTQSVDCQTVQVTPDEVWWTACVRHTDVRIESVRVDRKTLLRIQRSLGRARRLRRAARELVHPGIQRIHDLLYLDMEGGREFYSDVKSWDPDTIAAIAEVVAEYIPRPPPADSDDR
jgi:hypothetical protein